MIRNFESRSLILECVSVILSIGIAACGSSSNPSPPISQCPYTVPEVEMIISSGKFSAGQIKTGKLSLASAYEYDVKNIRRFREMRLEMLDNKSCKVQNDMTSAAFTEIELDPLLQ